MYRFIGDQTAYGLFNNVFAVYSTIFVCLLLVKTKTNSLGLYSKYAVLAISKKHSSIKNLFTYLLAFLELVIITAISLLTALFNEPFGNLVGTGLNYFGGLFAFLILGFIFSVIIMSNPMKEMDIATFLLPIRLFFLKVACFCNGCCWGIPWEHGLYNDNFNHPGKQVPVQAFEAFFALVILVFLLIYRKKAKTGTLFPMYMILYSATRFPVEFFSAAHEKIAGPFNTYHFLCIAGVIIGFILLLCVKLFGEKITSLFEKPHEKLNLKIAEQEERKMLKLAEEKAQAETAEKERLEKVRLAREKAKARRKK